MTVLCPYCTAIFILINQFLATRNMDSTGTGITSLQFNPDKHPHATLKAFNEGFKIKSQKTSCFFFISSFTTGLESC